MERMKGCLLLVGMVLVFMILDGALCAALDAMGSVTPDLEREKYLDANPPEEEKPVYHSMIATAYCLDGTTATGTHTRSGIAASKREWFGKIAKVYWNDGGQPGSLMGEYIIEDTGGRAIRNGSVIDIWMPTAQECFDFGRRVVFVEIID